MAAETTDAATTLDTHGPRVTGLLALVVGIAHLFYPELGFFTFAARVTVDPGLLVADPRPALFVVSGLGTVVGVLLARDAPDRRPYYLVGLAVFLGYVVGYFAWHLAGHGGFLPGREPLHHGLSPVENVLTHLGSDPFAAALLAVEAVVIVLLVVLLDRASG